MIDVKEFNPVNVPAVNVAVPSVIEPPRRMSVTVNESDIDARTPDKLPDNVSVFDILTVLSNSLEPDAKNPPVIYELLAKMSPATSNLYKGAVLPMPTFPFTNKLLEILAVLSKLNVPAKFNPPPLVKSVAELPILRIRLFCMSKLPERFVAPAYRVPILAEVICADKDSKSSDTLV